MRAKRAPMSRTCVVELSGGFATSVTNRLSLGPVRLRPDMHEGGFNAKLTRNSVALSNEKNPSSTLLYVSSMFDGPNFLLISRYLKPPSCMSGRSQGIPYTY